jgi:hypothetical protein
VKLRRQLRQNQQKPQLLSNFGIDDNDDIIVDDDVTFGRNRQAEKFGKVVHDEDTELSPYVKIRLVLARMKAMEAYKKAHA